ncbi:Uncharacterised protein [Bordetella pertussis]|nr:Uncharacterised protein [Bordetella pertussis]
MRDHPPVVDPAPRVRLPAAQVQDRRQRRGRRPRGGGRTRHRPASGRARRPAGFSLLGRRRAGTHAHGGPPDQSVRALAAPADLSAGGVARVQPAWPARQQVQGADQDPGQGSHARGLRARGRAGVAIAQGRPRYDHRGPAEHHRGPLRLARLRQRRGQRARSHGRPRPGLPALRALAAHQRARAQGGGLCGRDGVAEGHRRAARRHHRRPDGRGGWPVRTLWLRRTAGLARAEPGPGRRAPGPAARPLAGAAAT